MSGQKIVCLHFHIFKNAGTTIERILKNNFGKYSLSMDTGDPQGILSYDKILERLKKNPNTKSVSSHQIRFPIPKSNEFNFIPILFLRNPVDRSFSIYYFQRKRTNVNRLGIIKAKELSLNDYIKWNMEIRMIMPMKNYQVRFLSRHNPTYEVDHKDLKTAIKNINNCAVLGIVDRFDESLVLAEEVLRKYFPKIDLSYAKQNVSKEREGTSLEEKIENEVKKIEKSTYNELLKHNELDTELYLQANKELDKRIEKMTEYESKLRDFKTRCKILDKDDKTNSLVKNLVNRDIKKTNR